MMGRESGVAGLEGTLLDRAGNVKDRNVSARSDSDLRSSSTVILPASP